MTLLFMVLHVIGLLPNIAAFFAPGSKLDKITHSKFQVRQKESITVLGSSAVCFYLGIVGGAGLLYRMYVDNALGWHMAVATVVSAIVTRFGSMSFYLVTIPLLVNWILRTVAS